MKISKESARIQRKIKSLKLKIQKIQTEISDIQKNSCPHENMEYILDGYSNDWDRSSSYWINWTCSDCEHRFTTDQSYSEIQKYPQAKRVKSFS